MFRAAAVAILVACSGTAGNDTAPSPKAKPMPPVSSTSAPPAVHAHGTDLTTRARPLAATVELPVGATVSDGANRGLDAVGLATDEPAIRVALDGGTLELANAHGQGIDPDDDATYHTRKFELVTEQRRSTGEWSRAYAWGDGRCFITGGSRRADVRCHSHELKISCDAAKRLVEICASVEPKGPPLVPPTNLAVAFPNTESSEARSALGEVATAIMKDDRAAFERLVGPGGLEISRRRLSRGALHDALATKSVGALTGLDCKHECVWTDNTRGSHRGDHVEMTPDTVSYGIQHVVRLARQSDSAWRIVAIADEDLGRDGP